MMRVIQTAVIPVLFCITINTGIAQSHKIQKQQVPRITAAQLIQKTRSKNFVFLVDIRPEKEYCKYKIPDSLNIPLAHICLKSFLKSKPVILIHNGFAHRAIEEQACKLNGKGFNIAILQGGLAAWKYKGGKLEGNFFDLKTANRISPKAFFSGKDSENWLIVNTCSESEKNTMTMVPNSVFFLQQRFTAQTPLPLAVILINDNGQNYEKDLKNIPAQYKDRLFFLSGGINAYQTFLKDMSLANRPVAERIKTTDYCEACSRQEHHKK